MKKRSAGQSFLAMKEINAQAAILGKNAREKQKSIGEIVSELSIIKEQLRHPNVVRCGEVEGRRRYTQVCCCSMLFRCVFA